MQFFKVIFHLRDQNTTDSAFEGQSSALNSTARLNSTTASNINANSTQFKTAESRLFPVGGPGLPGASSGLISPFDVASFSKQLLPLINFHVKEKVKDFAKSLGDGAEFIEDALREGWKESPLNPHNFAQILNPTDPIIKHPNAFRASNSLRKPGVNTNFYYGKEKAPHSSNSQTKDGLMHEFGIDGYKHFQQSILRELEKQEEMKVEATIHTLFEQGERVQVIRGKPYDEYTQVGWKPVTAPTKNYEDPADLHSQIISPLHTSIFDSHPSPLSEIDSSSHVANSFHDFDNFNDNLLHLPARYPLVHEEVEELESKLKPIVSQQQEKQQQNVKHAKLSPIRQLRASAFSTSTTSSPTKKTSTTTPSKTPRLSSRYRKRHNNSELRVAGQSENVTKIADTVASASSITPRAVVRPIRLRNHNIHIFASSPRPSKFKPSVPSVVLRTEESRVHTSTDNPWQSPFSRSSTAAPKTTTRATTTKPTKKYVDKIKSSGSRGSIKFGMTSKAN